MLSVAVVGDRSGFRPATPDGNYVGLLCGALEASGAAVDRPPAGGECPARRIQHLRALRSLVRHRRPQVVLYYGHSTLVIGWLRLVTAWRSTQFVIDAVEWPPASRGPGLRAWLRARSYALLAYRCADGVLVISRELERRVASCRGGRIPSHRLPVLVDQDVVVPSVRPEAPGAPYVAYCGDLGGYLDDVLFLLRSLALCEVKSLRVVLVGRGPSTALAAIQQTSRSIGLSERVEIVDERLSHERLLALYAGAEALLAPLPDDLRSRSRFPSKVADYLLSGTPVVASAVGEVAELLEDGSTGYLAAPGSEASFAAALDVALNDPARQQVGRAGRDLALDALGLEVQGERLRAFLVDLVARGG